MNKICRAGGLVLLLVLLFSACKKQFSYETVENDPLEARIYTLPNGLKVYMTVNKETPRIQTYIAVRVGGKNDPAETTGLAHYFEHLMFKGTQQFGTFDYESEKVLLDQIQEQFDIYRETTDEMERKAIYEVIDSLSYQASKFAIPNEYDKLMTAIGANGTNAYTGFDMTVYVEDIPANQIENWAYIQADRFKNNVIRGFHTELETVYEEKNMSLTRDMRKVYETMLAALFPHHPYGTQTVLGTQEHLKNPSITKIKEYYKTWYVPNNMAICLSGDFDPDTTIKVINEYFGDMQPNPNLPKIAIAEEAPLKEPVIREVFGNDAENIAIGWRFPGAAHKDFDKLLILSQVLSNGKAGLFDVNLNQKQRVLGASAYAEDMSDYSMLFLTARPKGGQTLDDVKALLFEEIAKLKKGKFDENMLTSTINNFKLSQMWQMENNSARANMFVQSFINGVSWEDEVYSIKRMSEITKADIVDFANEYLKDGYAVVYKRTGKDPNEKKMDKPAITPIAMNRDTTSAFLKEIQERTVAPIEPQFLDFEKDLTKLTAKSDIQLLYRQNQLNDIFQLTYLFEMGSNNDPALKTAFDYLKYLGTSDMTCEELNAKFYNLACSYYISVGYDRTWITLAGLSENLPEALTLFENLLTDAQVDKAAYTNLIDDIIKSRNDAKLNQQMNFRFLQDYAVWGEKSPSRNILSEKELREIDPESLTARVKAQNGFEHRILYYGPSKAEELLSLLNTYHRVPEKLAHAPVLNTYKMQETTSTKILLAPYDAKQIYMGQYSNRGEMFDANIEPIRNLYNEYFGGGMNSIVFQEMRESRALAYSAWAGLTQPNKLEYPYVLYTYVATQNDKMMDAISTFNSIINDMPESETAFKLGKEGLISRLRTERTVRGDILWSYIRAQDLGLNVDGRIKLFNDVQTMTTADVFEFQKQWIKNRTYTYYILGDEKELDIKSLEKVGPIKRLSTKDIFGY